MTTKSSETALSKQTFFNEEDIMKFFHLNRVSSYSNIVVWQVWGKGLRKLFFLENKHWFLGR